MTVNVCLKVLSFSLTSGYLDLQGGADESHEGGGEVNGHVVVHRHVHQDESLMAAGRESQSDTTHQQTIIQHITMQQWKPRVALVTFYLVVIITKYSYYNGQDNKVTFCGASFSQPG